MPGMRTQDAFRVNRPSQFEGFSADFSGAGFSWMQFSTRILSPDDFTGWVQHTQAAPDHLSFARLMQIAQPTINQDAKPLYFSNADPNLFADLFTAVQQGQVFPVPQDIDTKAPNASPPAGPSGDIKSKS
jgi:cytochrome o ubiquinol oxidase subunit 2